MTTAAFHFVPRLRAEAHDNASQSSSGQAVPHARPSKELTPPMLTKE